MSETLLAVLTVAGLLTLLMIVSLISGAVENIRIAKHTGVDPRVAKEQAKQARKAEPRP